MIATMKERKPSQSDPHTPRRRFQFGLANIVVLVLVSALLFGLVRAGLELSIWGIATFVVLAEAAVSCFGEIAVASGSVFRSLKWLVRVLERVGTRRGTEKGDKSR
jgi:hypothetical protein